LTVTSGASGKGNGSVAYSVAANNTPTARSATITVAGNTFNITQAAGSCSFTVTPNPVLLTTSGGGGTISVTTSPGCSWTVSSPVAWLAIVGGKTGSGTATYYASGYQDNTVRKTTLTVAGQSIPVIQGAPPPPAAPSGFRIVAK